ncbi:MAG: hypothetical protein ACE5WD_06555 [Candidatus Aminicenantia bacterium]
MNENQAQEELKFIKEMMKKASRTFIFSGWQWVSWGIIFSIGSLFTYLILIGKEVEEVGNILLFFWIGLSVVGILIEFLIFRKKVFKLGIGLFSKLVIQVTIAECFMTFLGVILTYVLINLNSYQYIPGLWLLVMGVTFTIAGMFSFKEIIYSSLMLIVSGVIAIVILPNYSLLIFGLFAGLGFIIEGMKINIKHKEELRTEG